MVGKLLLATITLLIGFAVYSNVQKKEISAPLQKMESSTVNDESSPPADIARMTYITGKLDTPWALAFLPDNSILVTERTGRVSLIDPNSVLEPEVIATLDNAKEIGEGGLLGITLHPDFENNHFLYLYYTYTGSEDNTLNRVVRMTYENKKLGAETVIVDSIPGASNHNGGRIKFGPDKYLYITTGDAQNPSQAQDTNSLSGKILRVTDEGKPAPGNPFNNRVYSYGHRNPQGLAWDKTGSLYATEHGRSGIQSGLDEFNLIEAGNNYGWPDIEGNATNNDMETPILNSGPLNTWAPGSLTYLNDAFYFGGLRGSALYKVTMSGDQPELKKYLKGEFGRIRDAVIGPDGMLYLTTSNLDGRGIPKAGDDKIIRINLKKL
jgi:glucose/arabinose dehydrogenase